MAIVHRHKIYESNSSEDRLWAKLFQLEYRIEKLEKEIKKINNSEIKQWVLED